MVVIFAVPDVQGDVQERFLVGPGTMFPLLVEAYPVDALHVDQEADLIQVLRVFRVPPNRNVRELHLLIQARIRHPGQVLLVGLGLGLGLARAARVRGPLVDSAELVPPC